MTEENNPYWSEKVTEDETYHTPPGTFTKSAPEVVNILLKGAGGDAELALRRLVFYMNRAGNKLDNRQALENAKQKLEELEKNDKRLN